MAVTLAVKEAVVHAVAITITFPHCNIGISEINGNTRTTIFQCISQPFESQISLKNIHLIPYTLKKNFNGHPAGGKVTLNIGIIKEIHQYTSTKLFLLMPSSKREPDLHHVVGCVTPHLALQFCN